MIKQTHQWFYYPVGWEGERYDSYALDTFNKKFLHYAAYLILLISVLIAILSTILMYKELKSKKNIDNIEA